MTFSPRTKQIARSIRSAGTSAVIRRAAAVRIRLIAPVLCEPMSKKRTAARDARKRTSRAVDCRMREQPDAGAWQLLPDPLARGTAGGVSSVA